MGRTTTNPVLRLYFDYNIDKNESTCNIKNCPNPVRSGRHAGNLETHIKIYHKDEYILLLKEKEKKLKSNESCSSIIKKQIEKQKKTGPLDSMITITKKSLNQVKLSKSEVIEACVQLVTTNGRPFSLLNDSGFKIIMDPIINSIGGGDFYGIWMQTKNKLNSVNTSLSKSIVHFMEIHEEKLLENDVFISTIYLDPRFMCLLSISSRDKAIKHLLKLWLLKESFQTNEFETSNEDIDEAMDEDNPTYEKEKVIDDEFESFIKTASQTTQTPATNVNNPENINATHHILLKKKLEDFAKIDRINYKENILHYWSSKKDEMPELFELSKIVMAVPATQVSVERSFSSLKFILSDLRSSLSNQVLENILIIRGNNV